jgi:hypothetical protein
MTTEAIERALIALREGRTHGRDPEECAKLIRTGIERLRPVAPDAAEALENELSRLLLSVGQLRCGDCGKVVDLLPHPDPDLSGWLRFTCGHRRILREEYERWLKETQPQPNALALPPCPRCAVPLTAISRLDDPDIVRFSCPRCEWTRAGLPYKGAAGLCHRCESELERVQASANWWAARCPRCDAIAAYERVEPPSVELLKRDWLKHYRAFKVARVTARQCWEKWQAADSELRRVLTGEDYETWVDSQRPEGGRWL